MKRNKHSLSHYKLATMDMGKLIPIACYEALPGDTIQQNTTALVRVSPLLSPVMHPVIVRIHHFFVPNRIIWSGAEDFITGGPDGEDDTVPPYITKASVDEGSLWDYLGVPPVVFGQNENLSALPVRAYNMIYNEHYRDQDLIEEEQISTDSGEDTTTNQEILNVSWEKDYFTTARPWETKGASVTIPLGESAPVEPEGGSPTYTDGTDTLNIRFSNGTNNAIWSGAPSNTANARWADPQLVANLADATGIEINDLRLALAIQRFQEARAKYGSRYSEYLRSLGIKSSDARLQNPEYLGGGRQVIQFSEVLQTAEGTAPVGSMKGHGIAAMKTNRYRRFIEEHGIIMTLMSVVPKSIYTQTLPRMWSRTVKEHYFQKELATIGEQEIPNKEAYVAHSSPTDVFGYQARYDEYRSIQSRISGEFHSTLNHWHYARIHSGDIALNQSFIDATPTKRVNASTGTDCLYVMANHSIQARRMVPSKATTRTF